MNTSAPLFSEQDLATETEKNIAELYCRIYALAAEDFTTTADVDTYIKAMSECLRSIQQALTNLFQIVSTHTHNIPPHTHPMEPHFHSTPSGPSGPNIGAFFTLATPLVTEVPMQSQQIRWTEVPTPVYQNTTLTSPNLGANRVVVGPTLVGPLTMNERRAKTPTVLMKPSILPLVKGMTNL